MTSGLCSDSVSQGDTSVISLEADLYPDLSFGNTVLLCPILLYEAFLDTLMLSSSIFMQLLFDDPFQVSKLYAMSESPND